MQNNMNLIYPQLESFLRVLQRSNNSFSLVFVECNSKLVFDEICTYIYENTNINYEIIDVEGIEGCFLDEYLKDQVENLKKDCPLFIKNFDSWIPYFNNNINEKNEKTINNISSLNWRRNYFRDLKRTIVFWLPSYALELISQQASDFYDWYSDLYEFKNPKKYNYILNEITEDSINYNAPMSRFLDKEVKSKKIRELFSLLNENLTKEERTNILRLLFNLSASMDNYVLSFEVMRLLQEILPDLDEPNKVKYNNDMGYIFLKQGDLKKSFDFFENARKDLKKIKDPHLESSVYNNLAEYYRVSGKIDKAQKYFTRALKILKNYPLEYKVHLILNLCSIDIERRDYKKAIEKLLETISFLDQNNDLESLSSSYNNLAYAYAESGELELAYKYFHKSLNLSKIQGDKTGEAIALFNLAEFIYKKNFIIDTAEKFYNDALKVALEVNNSQLIGSIYSALAHLLFKQEKYNESLDSYNNSINYYKKIGNDEGLAQIYLNLAAIYSKIKCYELEEKNAEKSLEHAQKSGNKVLIDVSSNLLKHLYSRENPLT